MSGFLMSCSSWFYFLLRMCCIFKILYKLGNFGLYYAHYCIKFWRFCLLLLLIFLQWVIFLYFTSNFPGWIWAANCFLCSSSRLFSVFSFLSPLFLSLSSWAILSLFHAWMVQGSIKQSLGIPLSGHFYHRIWPLTSAFIVFWLYFSHYTYQKYCEFSHMHSCHHLHTTWFHLAPG